VDKQNYFVWDLEKHQTKDIKDSHINGDLTVIWRDWDHIIKNPEMIYLNTVNPGEIKGPHVHKNRTSYFYCIEGKMAIIVQGKNGEYHEIETDSTESKLISVSNGVGAAIINPSKSISKILVLADISWKPDDNEMKNISFTNYDWKKWFK
jgi:dTDP-4-dehydrorhamnose 3,5-epimerase|tara:strand:+ start:71 stop:520 length:450 start_codon:yes stop_codon:yes gene_type:complete